MAKLSKHQIKATFTKARAAQQAGRLEQAEKGYAKLLAAGPALPEVHFNLAEVQAARGRFAPAAQQFEAALKLRPSEPAIWVSYLMLASKHPNPKNFDILRRRAALVLQGSAPMAYFDGLAALRAKDWPRATALFETADKGGVKRPELFADYGTALSELGRSDAALAQFDRALQAQPENDLFLYRKAEHLRKTGALADAKVVAQQAIDAAPHMGGPYALYVSLGKVSKDDPNVPRMRNALERKRAGDPDITTLCTALAKAMEDAGKTDQVFAYLNRGNAVAAKAYPYDARAAEDGVRQIRDVFEKVKAFEAPCSDAAPIFVTGAPRSGTSLVEQILSAHSRVAGGGELGLLQPKLSARLLGAGDDAPDAILSNCKDLADGFAAELDALHPGAGHVTDKSISTYLYIGLLQKVMPKARFIVVRRDPRDNALSIYKNHFQDGLHRYSNDLRHIAGFLRQFEGVISYWREASPEPFHEINYEDLIADPEPHSKALIAAAGLEWEEACLSFYETKRVVRTLSSAQVRQPIYASSVGAWRTFEADMAPFLEAYGPVA